MPYTVLVNNDNTTTITEKSRIMQRTKNVDNLRIIIPKDYEGKDMSGYTVLMEYKLPLSNEVKLEQLQLADPAYKEDYLLYVLPMTTQITKENGNVAVQLSIVGLEMDAEGDTKEIARNISPFIIPIVPVTDWFTVPDSELTTLTQYYLAAQQQIQALNDLVGVINQNKADSISLDVINGEIHLTSGGEKIGKAISVEELGNEIAERTTSGTVKINQ